MKHCKVEVYLLEFKLCLYPELNKLVSKSFSCADTIGTQLTLLSFVCLPLLHLSTFSLLSPFASIPADLEAKLRSTFDVEKDVHCRVWHRYMTSTYELLSDPKQSLRDAGLYNGQVCVCRWLRGGRGRV